MPVPSSRLSGCSLDRKSHSGVATEQRTKDFPALRDKLLDNSLVQSVHAELDGRARFQSRRAQFPRRMGGKAVRPLRESLAVQAVQTSKTQERDAKEPLDERETFTEFETYLVKKNLSPEAQRARRVDFSSVRRAPESLENAGECHHEEQLELTPVEEDGPTE